MESQVGLCSKKVMVSRGEVQENKMHLVLGKVELSLGGLTRAISSCKCACAPATATADLIQPVHGGPEPVTGGHIHHAVVHDVRQRCTDENKAFITNKSARLIYIAHAANNWGAQS